MMKTVHDENASDNVPEVHGVRLRESGQSLCERKDFQWMHSRVERTVGCADRDARACGWFERVKGHRRSRVRWLPDWCGCACTY